jgi:hypothetical protein
MAKSTISMAKIQDISVLHRSPAGFAAQDLACRPVPGPPARRFGAWTGGRRNRHRPALTAGHRRWSAGAMSYRE